MIAKQKMMWALGGGLFVGAMATGVWFFTGSNTSDSASGSANYPPSYGGGSKKTRHHRVKYHHNKSKKH